MYLKIDVNDDCEEQINKSEWHIHPRDALILTIYKRNWPINSQYKSAFSYRSNKHPTIGI